MAKIRREDDYHQPRGRRATLKAFARLRFWMKFRGQRKDQGR